jgi:ubiquinone/menaquinone biosynthesis C-methylase UbiE
MERYYSERLAGERLRACYDLAPPRVKDYLDAEIAFVARHASQPVLLLEFGCGYGRVLEALSANVRAAVGIDTSIESLNLARKYLRMPRPVRLLAMDASQTAFSDRVFDLTICIQNGVSAFAVDQQRLLAEAVRVTRSGGTVLFSSYSEHFWDHRMAWFEVQAAHGLIGEIDHQASGNGVIVCKDGFRATTVGAGDFRRLAGAVGLVPTITEVAGSSLFLEVTVP